MTPKKRERITEDVLRQVRERCQQEMPKIRADLNREYWMGERESDVYKPPIALRIASWLLLAISIGWLIIMGLLLLRCGV
jgi:hypothetical protein